MSKLVEYSRTVESEAMSKGPKQNGMYLSIKTLGWGYDANKKYGRIPIPPVVVLQGRNPKTNSQTSHLKLEIPVEDIDKLIEQLIAIRNEAFSNTI